MGLANTKIIFLVDASAHTLAFLAFGIWFLYTLVTKKDPKTRKLMYSSMESSIVNNHAMILLAAILSGVSAFCYWALFIDIGAVSRPIDCESSGCLDHNHHTPCDTITAYWLEWVEKGLCFLIITVMTGMYLRMANGWYQIMLVFVAFAMTMGIWIVLSCTLVPRIFFGVFGALFWLLCYVLLWWQNRVPNAYGYFVLVASGVMAVAYAILLALSPEVFGIIVPSDQWIAEMCYLIFDAVLRMLIICFIVITMDYHTKGVKGLEPSERVSLVKNKDVERDD